jgi:hypothetical protein
MDSRYKKKALTGFGIWLTLVALGVTLFAVGGARNHALSGVGIVLVLVGLPFYLWGCTALAKAKGHSTAIVLTFVLGGLFPLVLLLVLPDKNQRRRW